MLRTPLLVQTMGEVTMKVWRVQLARAASGIAFRHRRRGGCCNCAEILAEVVQKHTAAVLARGKLCVPLQMIHCDSGTTEAFLLELRPRGASHHCPGPPSAELCLRSSKLRPTKCKDEISENDNCELERVQRSYAQIIKDLIENVSSKHCAKKGNANMDKRDLIELCLKNNVSTEKIVFLLNGMECNKDSQCEEEFECNNDSECEEESEEEDIPKVCRNCMESEQKQRSITLDCENESRDPCASYSSCTGLKTKNFKIVSSPSINDAKCCVDNVIDCVKPSSLPCSSSFPCYSNITEHSGRSIPMYKTVRANSYRNQQSEFNHDDIKEIKSILNDIVAVLCRPNNITHSDKGNKIPTITKNKNQCKDDDDDNNKAALNVDNILNLILSRHVSQCTCAPSGECNDLVMMDNCDSHEYVCNGGQTKHIPINTDDQDKIYRYLPNTIPLIKDKNKISTRSSFENKSFRPSATFNHSTNIEIQHNTEKNSLQIKETPPALVEYLKTLLPQNNRDGVTHIHYYAKDDSGLLIAQTGELNKSSSQAKYSKEQKSISHDDDCKENLTKGYSHVIIDINNQLFSDKNVEEKVVTKENKL